MVRESCSGESVYESESKCYESLWHRFPSTRHLEHKMFQAILYTLLPQLTPWCRAFLENLLLGAKENYFFHGTR